MSLHVRLSVGFWNHRKTLRLRSLIGEAALWVPPRLWSYAASNQPDGDFSDYSDEEIAMLLDYSGNAQELLKALLTASFMDCNKHIHDWNDHNGYHSVFAARAKIAATARWKGHEKKRQDKKGKDKIRKEPSIALSNAKALTPSKSSDSEWLQSLVEDKTYEGIDVPREHGKMIRWCSMNGKEPTRRRFVNWLNRADKRLASPASTSREHHYEPPPREITDEEREKNRQIAATEVAKLKNQFTHN